MASRLIIEGNAVYEIDEECYSRKMEVQDAARKGCGREAEAGGSAEEHCGRRARAGENAEEQYGRGRAEGEIDRRRKKREEPVQCQEQ